jgi:FixJ family two-component response regulator
MTEPTKHIAVLDDDVSVRRAMTRLLEAFSYRVQTYDTGRDFIDSLSRQVPDCLILDMQMEEMTGEQLLRHLDGAGTRIPTIMLTGHNNKEVREKCVRAGAVAFLAKPVNAGQLLKAIDAATGEPA